MRPLAVAVALVAVLLAGCANGSGPDGAASPSTEPVPGTSATLAPPATASLSTAEREAADRRAVEQAWARYWEAHQGLLELPAADRAAAVDAVAVDPTRQEVLDEAETFEKGGLRFYGQVVNHPYWQTPIDGRDVAVMGDCMDSSRAGTLVAKTGVKRTVGVAKNNTRASFVKGTDGIWRVEKIEYLVDTPC